MHGQDEVLAVDLEWRPDFHKGACSQVALVQLASARHAVLIRSCYLGSVAKKELKAFLRCCLQSSEALNSYYGPCSPA